MSTSAKPKIYYGWIVVFASFAMFTIAFAIQYSFGIFFKPLQDTFGWSRATTSWAMTIHIITFSLFMLPAGWAIDRLNTRILLSIGAFVVGISTLLSSRISQPWQLYLLYGILGIGICVCGPPIVATVTRWFVKNRGMALGVATAGTGFGIMIGAPISNALISSYGWRNAFVMIGIVGCAVLLVCAYYIKRPSQISDNQNGSSAGKQTREIDLSSSMSFGQAIRTREIYLVMIAAGAAVFTLRVVMVHLAPHAIDIGISEAGAAFAIGAIGGFSALGRLVMGFIQDKIGPRRSMIICLGTQALCMLALPFIRSNFLFYTYTVIFGFVYGGDIPQVPAITAQLFGVASIGMIFGLVQAVAQLMSAAGPVVAGYVFDLTNSYTTVFLGAAASLVVGVIMITLVKVRK